jgi:hypothetical protein
MLETVLRVPRHSAHMRNSSRAAGTAASFGFWKPVGLLHLIMKKGGPGVGQGVVFK